MQIKLNGDERLSTGFAAAGAIIAVTGANADELFGLVTTFRAILIDDKSVSAVAGDIGPAYASFVARYFENGLALTDASPSVGATPGAFLARVRTQDSTAALTLVNDGGGRVVLSGRSLLAGLVGFLPGVPVSITLKLGSDLRTFILYPANNIKPIDVSPLGITFSDGTLFQFSDGVSWS